MIITLINCGMGNQMFTYAAGLSLATRLHTELYLDTNYFRYDKGRTYCLYCFPNITEPSASFQDIWQLYPLQAAKYLILRKPIGKYNFFGRIILKIFGRFFSPQKSKLKTVYAPIVSCAYTSNFENISDNTFITGNWESEKFFADIKDLIREKFKFAPECFNPELSRKIKSCNSVAIHVRRGDKSGGYIFLPSTEYYLKRALEKISSLTDNPKFFVFSDDIDWCKLNLPQIYEANYTFIEGQTPPQDMALMTICKHVIMGPSTFSWWGAWLNENPNKIIIAPDINLWFKNDENMRKDNNFANLLYENRRDYLLEEWIKIS